MKKSTFLTLTLSALTVAGYVGYVLAFGEGKFIIPTDASGRPAPVVDFVGAESYCWNFSAVAQVVSSAPVVVLDLEVSSGSLTTPTGGAYAVCASTDKIPALAAFNAGGALALSTIGDDSELFHPPLIATATQMSTLRNQGFIPTGVPRLACIASDATLRWCAKFIRTGRN